MAKAMGETSGVKKVGKGKPIMWPIETYKSKSAKIIIGGSDLN